MLHDVDYSPRLCFARRPSLSLRDKEGKHNFALGIETDTGLVVKASAV